MSESSLGTAALTLAEQGYYVFPCQPRGKKPLTKTGFKVATRDPQQIARWWRQIPQANIGIACEASGLVVLDIDSKAGADPQTIIGELGLEDHRPAIQTGAAPAPTDQQPHSLEGVRGAQLYFRAGDVLPGSATRLQGVEFRRGGQYVVAPPSIHPSGVAYEGGVPPVDALPLLPEDVSALSARSSGERAAPVGETIAHGDQHRTLVSLAGSMRQRGMDAPEIAAALKVVNATRCEVPGTDEAMEKIARSVAQYEPGEPLAEPDDIDVPAAADGEAPPSLIVFAGDLEGIDVPEQASWFEQELLPIGGLMLIHGPAKSFKSFLALDMLSALAQGRPWCHFEPTEEPTKVCVVQFEIPLPYYLQRADLLRSAAAEPGLFDENFGTFTPRTRPRLVAGDAKTEDPILEALVEAEVQVVMIDPIRRGMGFASMNDENEVRKMLAFFERLNDEGITVVATHHNRKANARGGEMEAMTGSGAFGGDADSVLSISVPRKLGAKSTFRNVDFVLRNAPAPSTRSFQMTEEGALKYALEPINADDPEEEGNALPDF